MVSAMGVISGFLMACAAWKIKENFGDKKAGLFLIVSFLIFLFCSDSPRETWTSIVSLMFGFLMLSNFFQDKNS